MIQIDFKDSRPIYEQIVAKYKELILKGILETDSKLPSVRNLAMELSINPNTIQKSYAELERQGFIYTVKGRGNFVAEKEELLVDKQNELLEQLKKLITQAIDLGISPDTIVTICKETSTTK